VTVLVRLERPEDRPAALDVERRAFGSDEEVAIVEAVRDEEGSFALVAEDDGAIVGHVQLSRAGLGEVDVVALGPIGVVPERQGEGIGSALIRAALEEARSRGEPAVILLGSQSFYPRFGFAPASMLGLRNPFTGVLPSGFEILEEDFMIARLDARPIPAAGEVRWHPAFGQAG
jgi:predicted N-acetyltransferase YhbS